MTFLKLAQREFSALQLDSVHLVFYFLVFTPMCFRTLANLHRWDTELPTMAARARVSVYFTLISAWNEKEGGKKILFHCLQSCTCLYLTFVVAVIGAVCVVSRVCDPTLAWCFHGCFHWGFHWRSPRCSPPPTSVAVYLESATASGESRGAFWSLLARSQFCCLGRFYRRGVTQLCIVFYSLALLGVHLKFGSSESTK